MTVMTKLSFVDERRDDYFPPRRDIDDESISAARLLKMAIDKRTSLHKRKERDLRRELLVGATIQRLCRHIGEERASRKQQQQQRHRQRRRRRHISLSATGDIDRSVSAADENDNNGEPSSKKSHRTTTSEDISNDPTSLPVLPSCGNDGGSGQEMHLPPISPSFNQNSRLHSSESPIDANGSHCVVDNDPFGLNVMFEPFRGQVMIASRG